jgi:hypothetical protein
MYRFYWRTAVDKKKRNSYNISAPSSGELQGRDFFPGTDSWD